MDVTATNQQPSSASILARVRENAGLLVIVILLVALPFILAIVTGQPIAELLENEAGQAKFIQGLMIEVFILAIFALSYDLIFGITGLLSFGHAMFFASAAYLTGIMLKSFAWSLGPTFGLMLVAAVVQALLFGLVLPRVRGVTFALVTLGFAEVFHIIIQSREAAQYTGADVGLQGIIPPDWLNPSAERLRFYFLALALVVLAYLVARRFVSSPTGRVCVAIRENEDRALMLGYNTFYFKLAALILSAIMAGVAGMLHALYQPLVSPGVASLTFTVNALLMVLVGGIGTLSGALLGAGILRLLTFYFDKWFAASAGFLLGAVYVTLVLLLPYGIIGTWRLRRLAWREGWRDLLRRFGLSGRDEA
ncbi:MAG: branched-chain amino acid ABC transporter permease [Anaerolineae bacterium]|nr:branched-chain amino acid ABC transporter permease [Anaerolineae bacterium]